MMVSLPGAWGGDGRGAVGVPGKRVHQAVRPDRRVAGGTPAPERGRRLYADRLADGRQLRVARAS